MILEDELKIRLEMTGRGFGITSEDISISPYHEDTPLTFDYTQGFTLKPVGEDKRRYAD